MTILGGLLKALNTRRLPQTVPYSLGLGQAMGQMPILDAYTATGWLWGVINRIASSVAMAEGDLYQKRSGGDLALIERHPFLDFWNAVNPFDTREEHLEMTQQHIALLGESFWVLVNGSGRIPAEMWVVRPDRIRPVPHPTEYISGYLYTMGGERVP